MAIFNSYFDITRGLNPYFMVKNPLAGEIPVKINQKTDRTMPDTNDTMPLKTGTWKAIQVIRSGQLSTSIYLSI
jgi:hypothetical protein